MTVFYFSISATSIFSLLLQIILLLIISAHIHSSSNSFRRTRYDKNVNVFSNEGELLQVEYARKAGRRGSSIICVDCEDNEILLMISSPTKRKANSTVIMDMDDIDDRTSYDSYDTLLDKRSVDKLSRIHDNLWLAFSGLGGDGRYLLNEARVFSVAFKRNFGFPPTPFSVARELASLQHKSTILRGTTNDDFISYLLHYTNNIY